MTPPVQPELTTAQKMAANLDVLRQHNASRERIQQEIDRWKVKFDAESAADPERQRTVGQDIQGAAQTFGDAATFGGADLVTDALAPGSFAENRAATRANKAGFREAHPVLAPALEVGGALATPIPGGTLLKGVKGAGALAKIGRGAADAAIQSGVSGTVNNLTDATPEGVLDAIKQGGKSALIGAGVAGTVGAVGGVAARAVDRLKRSGSVPKRLFELKDVLASKDKVNYGKAEAEGAAAAPLVRPNALDAPDIKPYADEVRTSREFQGADEPTVIRETYKRLGQPQRAAIKQTESGDFKPLAQASKEELRLAKADLMTDAEKAMPSFPAANAEHAKGAGEIRALRKGAGVAAVVGGAKPISEVNLDVKSAEAYTRAIPKLTPAEAEEALRGILGSVRGMVGFSRNPIGLFGIARSAVGVPLAIHRLGPIVRQLEKQAGRGQSGESFADFVRGATARTVGAETGQLP